MYNTKKISATVTCKKQACLLLIPCVAYSSTLKMEAARSSEMSVNFYLNIWCHIAEVFSLISITHIKKVR
jgi:hypothetical protein